jgi:hypothetical protein
MKLEFRINNKKNDKKFVGEILMWTMKSPHCLTGNY